jgi:sRNA-binding protein
MKKRDREESISHTHHARRVKKSEKKRRMDSRKLNQRKEEGRCDTNIHKRQPNTHDEKQHHHHCNTDDGILFRRECISSFIRKSKKMCDASSSPLS